MQLTVQNGKQQLKGSESRDMFKYMHKQTHPDHWACDLDFVLVAKFPTPDVIAVLDYKTPRDTIGFSEVIAYNAIIKRGLPVFIVYGDAEKGMFSISRYYAGNHQKPTWKLIQVATTASWDEFHKWEANIRAEYVARFSIDCDKISAPLSTWGG